MWFKTGCSDPTFQPILNSNVDKLSVIEVTYTYRAD